jgi:peptide/nickel transport system permease protein
LTVDTDLDLTAPPGASVGGAVARMVLGRVLGTVVMLFVISVLVFLLTYLSPGNIITNITGIHPASPAVAAQLRHQYGLDKPLVVQYCHWLANFVQGRWGESIRDQTPVSQLFSERVGMTLLLCGLAFALAVVVSVPLGVIAAVRVGGLVDRAIAVTAVVGLSAPAFATGLLMIYFFAYLLPLFPPAGSGSGAAGQLYHLTLPALTLAAGVGAYIVRLTRTAMVRELASDYVVFARARGVPEKRVVRAALRNASVPVVTTSGLVLSYVVGATILVESTFSLPGLGSLLQGAVEFKDFAVVQFLTLFIATIIALVMLGVDLLYLALSPDWRRSSLQ